jgi:hypothetical protein
LGAYSYSLHIKGDILTELYYRNVEGRHNVYEIIDDGLADSGILLAGNTTHTNTDGERCVDNTKTGSGGAGASFDFDETGEDCHLMFAF